MTTTGEYTEWSEWSQCSASCGEGHQLRTRVCESELPLSCTGDDFDSKSCNEKECTFECEKLKMITQYDNPCRRSQTNPMCPEEPWWHRIHMRQFFRFTGNYHLTGHDAQNRPIYTKKSNDIMMYYNDEASSWVIKNDEQNMIFATSDKMPNNIESPFWSIKIDDEFVNADSVNATFTFECVIGEAVSQPITRNVNLPTWGEWAESYSYPIIEDKVKCSHGCGDIANKVRTRECSVEDLCVGSSKDYKRCNINFAPEICENQHGECDAEGFR